MWVHEEDAAVAGGAKSGKNEKGASSYLLRPEFYRTVFSLVRRGAGRIVPIREASTFADGETVDVPRRPRIVHAPGHTPGCSALYMEGRCVLFSGDALVTKNPLTGRSGPQIMPSAFNRDSGQALRSLDLLRGISADVVLPRHGDPWTDGVDEAARRARAAGSS